MPSTFARGRITRGSECICPFGGRMWCDGGLADISCVSGAKFDLLANQFSEILGGLHRLQAAIEADRRLNIPVSKQPPHGLVVPRPVLEIDRRRSMPELVTGDPKSHRLLKSSSKLKAERDCHL